MKNEAYQNSILIPDEVDGFGTMPTDEPSSDLQ